MKNKMLTLSFILFLLSSVAVFTEDVYTDTSLIPSIAVSQENNDTITPRSEDNIWRYKTNCSNTNLRKYNATKKQWIGDWELVHHKLNN